MRRCPDNDHVLLIAGCVGDSTQARGECKVGLFLNKKGNLIMHLHLFTKYLSTLSLRISQNSMGNREFNVFKRLPMSIDADTAVPAPEEPVLPDAQSTSPETTQSAPSDPSHEPQLEPLQSPQEPPQDGEAQPESQPEEEDAGDGHLHRVHVEYCPRCRVPIGYCRFFGHDRAAEAAAIENGEIPEEPTTAQTPAQKQKKLVNINIIVKQRSKRKHTTTIQNLPEWGIDVKPLSKFVRAKMSIGCSTKKTKAGATVVVIQGNAASQITGILTQQFNVPKDKITVTTRLIKKKKAAVPPPQPAAPEPVEEPEEKPLKPWEIPSRDYSEDDGEEK